MVFFFVNPSETPQERLKVSEGLTKKKTMTTSRSAHQAHITAPPQHPRPFVSGYPSETFSRSCGVSEG
jgi:hypothetical protein